MPADQRGVNQVKKVTVSLNEKISRQARKVAAERGTTLSALVRTYLENLGSRERDSDRLKKAERALRAQICGFRAGDGLPRHRLHERDA
jgi:hypothetical protein